jgi:hypothetical protein
MNKSVNNICAVLTITMLFSFVIFSCQSTPVRETESSTTITSSGPWQTIIDNFLAIKPHGMPDNLNPSSGNGNFDINSYFSVLTHLSMEPGWVLDYLYLGSSFGGRPIIYVRKTTDKPFSSYEEYEAAQNNTIKLNNIYDFVGFVMYGDTSAMGNKIRIDGTPEGYFEYVLLQLMGGQFYLSWHANYDDITIILDKNKAENILTQAISVFSSDSINTTSSDGNSYFGIMAKVKFIDFQPMITINNDTVTVKFITFTKWGGFIQNTFTINKVYPHTITEVSQTVLVEYQCGVMF